MQPRHYLAALCLTAFCMLSGCSIPAQAERSAHEAFRIACDFETIRFAVTETPDGVLTFTANCQREK